MQTLYYLCLQKIIDFNLATNKLPNSIKKDLNLLEIKKICSNTVSKIKKFESSSIKIIGINYNMRSIEYVLLDKIYIIRHILDFEASAKTNKLFYLYWKHCCCVLRSYVLYYIKQEINFNDLYGNIIMFCGHVIGYNMLCEHCKHLDKIGA